MLVNDMKKFVEEIEKERERKRLKLESERFIRTVEKSVSEYLLQYLNNKCVVSCDTIQFKIYELEYNRIPNNSEYANNDRVMIGIKTEDLSIQTNGDCDFLDEHNISVCEDNSGYIRFQTSIEMDASKIDKIYMKLNISFYNPYEYSESESSKTMNKTIFIRFDKNDEYEFFDSYVWLSEEEYLLQVPTYREEDKYI